MNKKQYHVIILGGSYAGLSAALSLVRSLRNVLIIDDGNPCNKQVPLAHNLIGHDGQTPEELKETTRVLLSAYPGFHWHNGTAVDIQADHDHFMVKTSDKESFTAAKALFATGLKDIQPKIKGFKPCWGRSIFSCPYCDAYEQKDKAVAVIGNGKKGFEMALLIRHWCQKVMLFTRQNAKLSKKQKSKLTELHIPVIEHEIQEIVHLDGKMSTIKCASKTGPLGFHLEAAFATLEHVQHCDLPSRLGCQTIKNNLIKINHFHETTIKGIYAAGDCCSMFRSIATAIADGNKTGSFINQQLISESY